MLFGQLAGSSSWNPEQLRSALNATGTCTAAVARSQVGSTAHFQAQSHCPALPKENIVTGSVQGTMWTYLLCRTYYDMQNSQDVFISSTKLCLR